MNNITKANEFRKQALLFFEVAEQLFEVANNLDNNATNSDYITLKKTSRLEQLKKLFIIYGDMTWQELLFRNNNIIPKGTLCALLNNKNNFIHKNGKWSLIN